MASMREVAGNAVLSERKNVVTYLHRRAGEFRSEHKLLEAMAIDDLAREIENYRHRRAVWDANLYNAQCIAGVKS